MAKQRTQVKVRRFKKKLDNLNSVSLQNSVAKLTNAETSFTKTLPIRSPNSKRKLVIKSNLNEPSCKDGRTEESTDVHTGAKSNQNPLGSQIVFFSSPQSSQGKSTRKYTLVNR